MIKISSSYRLSICVSVFLHIILLFFLGISTQHATQNGYRFSDQNKSIPIINATAVDQQVVSNQKTKKQKQIAKKTYKEKLQRQVVAFKKKRIIEQEQLSHIQARRLKLRQQQERAFTAWKQVLAMKKQKQNALEKRQKQLQEEFLQQEMAQEKAQVTRAQQMVQMQCIVNQYKAQIIHIIEQQWIVPTAIRETNKNLLCILLIHLAPGGNVLSVETVRSSGDVVLDHSARMAVFKASPLPVPKNMTAFSKFRELRLTVRPAQSSSLHER